MAFDTAAAPLLQEVMAAAGQHDRDRCLRLLAEAERHLCAGRHKAKPDIAAAAAAARAGAWEVVWGKAYQAICGLTWTFPPDLALCPPRPGPQPFPTEATSCGCGQPLPPSARFCSHCGVAVG